MRVRRPIFLAAVLLLACPVAAAARGASVGSLPAKLNGKTRVTVSFRAAHVPVFLLSGDERRDKADRRLKAVAKLSHGRGKARLTLPHRLSPGAYFVLACPKHGGERCAASRTPGVLAPPKPGSPGAPKPPPAATVVPDTGAAATLTVGSGGGGTLTATGPGGTAYTLAINPGAVPAGTVITMTPLVSLSGGGLKDKVIAGVQFAPEGLRLIKGGTLTIKPAHRIPLRRQVALGYSGAGADAHVVPLAPSRSAIEIPLAHFSGAAVGSSPDGAGPSGEPTPSDDTGFYSQLLAGLVDQWRDGTLSESAFKDAALSVLADYLQAIMTDEVPPGLGDDAAANTAMDDLITYARWGDTLAIDAHGLERVTPTVIKLLEGIYGRAQQRCAGHDLSAMTAILAADRQEQLLGVTRHTFAEDFQCLTFKVEFNSQISDSGGNFDGTYDLATTSEPTVSPDAVGVLKGEAPITYTEASGTKSQSFTCPDGSDGGWTETDTITGSTPGTANVLRLSLPDLSQIAGPGADLTVHLLIDPGMPREILSADREPQCGEGANTSAPVDFWYGDFVSTPLTGQSPGTAASEVPFGETLATDFTLQLDNGNPEVAHAVYSGSTTGDDGDDVTEQTTIDIVHTPPRP